MTNAKNELMVRGGAKLPARMRIERAELGVYQGKWLRRGFYVKRANRLRPPMSQRVDVRQLTRLETADGVRFEPKSLASAQGNLRTDETLLCLEEMTLPTKEGGRVTGDVSLSFRLPDDPRIVSALLNAGILQQIAVELPRRIKGALSAELGRWAQRDVIENLLPIRDRTLSVLRAEVSPDAERKRLNLGLEIINLTVLLRTPGLQRPITEGSSDLIADLARAREALGEVNSRQDARTLTQMFDGIIRQHLMEALGRTNMKVFVVPAEASGLLGSFADMEALAAGPEDGDGDGSPGRVPPSGAAA